MLGAPVTTVTSFGVSVVTSLTVVGGSSFDVDAKVISFVVDKTVTSLAVVATVSSLVVDGTMVGGSVTSLVVDGTVTSFVGVNVAAVTDVVPASLHLLVPSRT